MQRYGITGLFLVRKNKQVDFLDLFRPSILSYNCSMLYYITGNKNKFAIAKKYLGKLGIEIVQKDLNMPEIQSHSPEAVARDKAEKAFAQLQQPLFVSDHFWSITALNGFPGAYMRYMNEWLSSQDFLNLMLDKDNREIILTEALYYIDGKQANYFSSQHTGKLLREIRGDWLPAMNVTSLSPDNQSVSEKLRADPDNPSVLLEDQLWKTFAKWYNNT